MSPLFHWLSRSEHETFWLGGVLGEELLAGAIVVLTGNLGAGKTRLVQGIATGLGIDRLEVGSPTFVLIHEYAGRLPVYHFDVYRLKDVEEFLALGAEEYLGGDGVCLIEWGEQVADVLPDDHLSIVVEIVGENDRMIKFVGHGPLSASIVRNVQERCSDIEIR